MRIAPVTAAESGRPPMTMLPRLAACARQRSHFISLGYAILRHVQGVQQDIERSSPLLRGRELQHARAWQPHVP